MITASPITRQTVGRTFIGAICLLGCGAVLQLGAVVWAFIVRSHSPQVAIEFPQGTDQYEPITGTVSSGVPAVPEPNFSEDPVAVPNETPATVASADPTPVRPIPKPAKSPGLPEPEQSARFKETIAQGRLLRERGEMSGALIRFREAAAMDARSPEAIFEIASTLDKMQLPDRAGEQWRRIYDMGESAGPFYTAAEAKLNQVKEATMRAAVQNIPAQSTADADEGIAPGKTLGMLAMTVDEQEDRAAAKHLIVRIPIKARSREKIDVRDLTIQVLFYDTLDNQSLVQTTANVSSRWVSAPADWQDSNIETLEVEYNLAPPDARASRRENRKYFGYLVRVYYKRELQAAAGEPDKLVQQFPPESKLPTDDKKP